MDRSRWTPSSRPDRPGFVEPDWDAPIDVQAYLAAARATATVKGMFINDVLRLFTDRKPPLPAPTLPDERFVAYKDYPVRRFMEMCVAAAQKIHPGKPLRQGLRLVGQGAYPTLAESLIGRVIFGVLGKDVAAVLRLARKGYQVSSNFGEVEIEEEGPAFMVYRLAEMYSFVDCYHVGVFEGAVIACDRRPEVTIQRISQLEARLLVEWY